MNNKRKNIVAIITIVVIALIAVAAVFVSYRLSNQANVVPTKSRANTDVCPDDSGVLLISSTPSSDGTYQSLCNQAGRVETCGGAKYCCPSVGGTWTTNMTNCPSANVTATTTAAAGGVGVACAACTSTAECSTGLTCDAADGRCKKTDGTTTCFEGSAACTSTAIAVAQVCVPTATITCEPDCPTDCGTEASVITTCKNSCGVATTKQCNATDACGVVDVSIVKKAYKDGTTTVIQNVARNQTFIYALIVKNNGSAAGTDITVTDSLSGENQDLLTFVDTATGCSFSNTSKTVTCSNISLNAGATKTFTFRVKVSNTAVNGDEIKNVSVVDFGTDTNTAENILTVSTVVSCNQTCVTNANCSTGLTCDTTSNTCRKSACTDSETCVCPTAAPTEEITAAPTEEVTEAPTAEPTEEIAEEPTATLAAGETAAPTKKATAKAETLPETGILDFPGIAAFGGGLMLAIVGILLAL